MCSLPESSLAHMKHILDRTGMCHAEAEWCTISYFTQGASMKPKEDNVTERVENNATSVVETRWPSQEHMMIPTLASIR